MKAEKEAGQVEVADNTHIAGRFSALPSFFRSPVLLVPLCYTLLMVALTWPLTLYFFGNRLPDGSEADRFRNLWDFWWVKRAVFNIDNPFQTTTLFYPYFGPQRPLPLYFQDLQLLNGLLTLPLQLIGGVGAAYNGVIFFSFVASASGAFALAQYLTHNKLAAFLAGLVYGFNATHWETVFISITNIMSTQYLPFYILFLHLWVDKRKWYYLAGASVALAASLYTDWYNTSYLVFYTGFYFIIRLWVIRRDKAWLRKAAEPLLPGIGALILGLPLLLPTYLNLNNPIFTPQLGPDRDLRSSTPLVTLLTPNTNPGAIFYASLLLGGFLLWQGNRYLPNTRKIVAYWFAFFLLCIVLTLGPELQITDPGDNVKPGSGFPLPYALFKLIPGLSALRAPERFMIPAQLGTAILAALALTGCWQFLAKLNLARAGKLVWLSPAFALLVIGGYILANNHAPLKLTSVEPYSYVNFIQSEQPSGSSYRLLELPITRHYQFDHPRMYNQIWHNQPIMGGFLARPLYDPYREPSSPFRYLADQSNLYGNDLQTEIFPAQYTYNMLDAVNSLYQFNYVVVYKNDYKFDKERQAVRSLLETQLGKTALVYEDANNLVYRVPQSHSAQPGLWLGEGWYNAEKNEQGWYRWSNQKADLYTIAPQTTRVKLSFSAQSFGGDRTLRVVSGDKTIFEGLVTPAPRQVEVEVEVGTAPTLIRIESATPAHSAKELGMGADTRPLAFLIRDVQMK